ncbi:hypothetical protein BD410DRAFT_829025 [Rickenella mellea]|uniref:Snf7-domain-containing protein n=1 Tax=Rickenella mellea TaxID=50990 RepID=A0A4Y7Q1J6_9AGAM|nr:hypothetical protein BD410DRAFT_829025 [Rickenella mellea]
MSERGDGDWLSSLPKYSKTSKSRLQSLYSDLARQKLSNPTSFNSNVAWWRETLESLAIHSWRTREDSSGALTLQVNSSLTEKLRYPGVGKPLGLGAVVMFDLPGKTELISQSALIPLESFLNASSSIYDSASLPYRIASYVITKPLSWALQQLNIINPDGEGGGSTSEQLQSVKGSYVVVRNLEHAADAVQEMQRKKAGVSPADELYSFESFKKLFGVNGVVFPDVSLSDTDLKVLLKFLSRDRKVIVTDKEVIKFVYESSTTNRTITPVDSGILALKSGVENLEAQVDALQQKIHERTEKINTALRAKRKDVALSHLRSRKQLEETLSKRLGSLAILQSTLTQVETAAGDIEIMKSYESSTATLRAILSHPSLQRERVEETMEAMAAASDEQREIDEVIRAGVGVVGEVVDEGELEMELAGLVEEVKKEESEKEAATAEARLPNVPPEPVGASSSTFSPIAMDASPPPQIPSTPQRLDTPTSIPLPETPSDVANAEWEARYKQGQEERAIQALRDKEAQNATRVRWEEETSRKAEEVIRKPEVAS